MSAVFDLFLGLKKIGTISIGKLGFAYGMFC